jgi:hypothetical protein
MKTPETSAEIAVHCAHAAIVDWSTLKPHPRNPNRHPTEQIALLAKNIRALGWRHPVIVSKLSGYIVAGHARIEAAKLLNINAVPVDYQPFASTDEETAYLIADNRIAELAERDNAILKDLLQELDSGATDMDLTGYTEQALEELMLQTHQEEDADAEPQLDRAEELRVKWGVETGDLWLIGEHRLLCGDSTNEADVGRLLGGATIESVLFDPEWDQMPSAIPSNSVLAFCDGATLGAVVSRYGSPAWVFAWDCITSWYTPNRPLRRMKMCAWYGKVSEYNPDGWHYGDSGEERHVQNTRGEYTFKPDPRGKHLSDVFSCAITKLHSESEHSHSKPTDWVTLLIGNCTRGTLFDPYAGSGTSFVACENLGRTCYGLEIAPGYCAVILERMKAAFPALEIRKEKR